MPVDPAAVPHLAADALQSGRLFSKRPLHWRHVESETSRWEVFQGRLLDPAHTRQEATFTAWNVYVETDAGLSAEPILSLKWDTARGILHVVRGLECYVHEGYSEGNVFQTREVRRWVRELIASFDLSRFDGAELREEVACALTRAVTGTRLPLTPVDAPMPMFTCGELFYFFSPHSAEQQERSLDAAIGTWLKRDLRQKVLPARLVEFWLRGTPAESLDQPPRAFVEFGLPVWTPGTALFRCLWSVFNDVSLSPWTDLAAKVIRLLPSLSLAVHVLDFESHLLRLVCRHLTAYDLVTFHHRGANYPDALLLDLVLNDYLVRLGRHPDLFAGDASRLRRRALRQAYLLRRRYENHPVPDVPTSPGEHMRVLPAGYPRVPEEQILNVGARRRRLYENDPLRERLTPVALDVLRQSVADLAHPDERRELSAAVYLDRPFGGAKGNVEPDNTPLLASLATSRSIASTRLAMLRRDLGLEEVDIGDLQSPGLPLDRIGPAVRMGTVSLADAARAAPDFVFHRTLPSSVRALQEWIDFGPFAERLAGGVLIARSPTGPGLSIYDAQMTPFAEIVPSLDGGYVSRRGVEYPANGVQVRPSSLP